jgi:hypothetical protein
MIQYSTVASSVLCNGGVGGVQAQIEVAAGHLVASSEFIR